MPLVPLAPFKTPRRAAASQVAELFNIPAPVGGLNFRDPIAAMSPNDALILDNFIPKQLGVELRKGYPVHVDAINEPIGSRWRSGLSVNLPYMRGVSSPKKLAVQACANSCARRLRRPGPFDHSVKYSGLTEFSEDR